MGLFKRSEKLHLEEPSREANSSYQAALANDLASTVEHVLSARYAGGCLTEQTASRTHGVAQIVNSESLLAELAIARQSRPNKPQIAEAEPPQRSRSPALRLFAFIGFAMIGYALLMKSPWWDQVPSIDRIAHMFN